MADLRADKNIHVGGTLSPDTGEAVGFLEDVAISRSDLRDAKSVLAPQEYTITYSLAAEATGNAVGTTYETYGPLDASYFILPETTAGARSWRLTIDEGTSLSGIFNVSAGLPGLADTTNWTRIGSTRSYYYSGDLFPEGTQYSVKVVATAATT